MNYVNEQNMQEILDGIARKIGTGGGSGAGLEDWQPSHEYIEKDICVYEGQIYRAKVGFTSDTTFNTTQILEEYTPVGGETIIPYEQDTEISIDDIVSYDNNTYKALYNFVCGEEFSLYALEEYVPIELTDDDIKEIVGAYNPVFEEAKGVEYSTEERRIGTWVDGKPLYQKTFNNPTLPLNTGLISTNYTIRHIDGMAHDTDTILKVPHVDYVGGNIYIYDGIFTPSTGVFTIRQTNMSSAVLDSITLQYTKTTD